LDVTVQFCKMKKIYLSVFLVAFFFLPSFGQNCNLICNSDFDSIQYPTSNYFVDSTQMPCWKTTAPDGQFEVWGSGFNGVPSYSGFQFLELNAYYVSTVYQDITAIPGTNLSISFAHRARVGIDTMSVSIGPVGGPFITLGYFADTTTAWGYYSINYSIPNMGNNYSIRFNSIYATLNNPAIGNFLDDVSVCSTNVGINEIENSNATSVFPNPFSDFLNITGQENILSKIIFYDITARKLFEKSFTGPLSLNAVQFSKGIYFYSIENINGKVKKGKLVKQ
jgi:hypothetical protein